MLNKCLLNTWMMRIYYTLKNNWSNNYWLECITCTTKHSRGNVCTWMLCSPVIFAWSKYDEASRSLVCNYFACGVMSKLPEVCLRIFTSSVCLLSHSVLNSIEHMTFYALCSRTFSFSHLCPCAWFFPCLEVTILPFSQLNMFLSPLR